MFKLFFMVAVVLLFAEVQGQEPHFSQSDTLELSWIPPADDDLSHYKAYFLDTGMEVTMLIDQWDEMGDSLRYVYFLPLRIGRWKVEMTAWDINGNESDRSEPFWFWIDDAKPGEPVAVKIILYKRE